MHRLAAFSLVPRYMIRKPAVDWLDQHTYAFSTTLRPQVIGAAGNISDADVR